jgi:hypothetical protein
MKYQLLPGINQEMPHRTEDAGVLLRCPLMEPPSPQQGKGCVEVEYVHQFLEVLL